jgi:ATP-dependent RNA helicase DDX52/ROK1
MDSFAKLTDSLNLKTESTLHNKSNSQQAYSQPYSHVNHRTTIYKKVTKSNQGSLIPISSFDELLIFPGFSERTLTLFRKNGWNEPTPIQSQVIPLILKRKEIIVIAPTGSGKTLAFLLPIMLGILQKPNCNSTNVIKEIQAVILSPTRELAGQITTVAKIIGNTLKINATTASKAYIVSGRNLNDSSIIIGTPKRLITFIDEAKVNLSSSRYLVIDEADYLLNEENIHLIDRLMNTCSNCFDVTRCLFSATFPESVEKLSKTMIKKPVRITVGSQNKPVSTIEQIFLPVKNDDEKLLTIRQLIKDGSLRAPILLFVRSKSRSRFLHRELLCDAILTDSIHANQLQSARNITIKNFEKGKSLVLIATNLISRGIDISRVKSVVNFDLPSSPNEYIHRVGRAGRCGRLGLSVTFYSEYDHQRLKSFDKIIQDSKRNMHV